MEICVLMYPTLDRTHWRRDCSLKPRTFRTFVTKLHDLESFHAAETEVKKALSAGSVCASARR